ncbi:actin-related protein 5 [Nematocida minor]|uniref:actin-related protein 5 n=1 Tax=Nematocida minor TaxID=1912983 RepID=UPI00221F9E0E|nr:actin-related protein 5 [Nematocida minor]KAI5192688.1 actin-related protein 5 [Nematocida minor]
MKKRTLLVVDNGTWECKAGCADAEPCLRFKNQIFRMKGKDGKITYSIAPNKKTNITTAIKSMFDGGVVYNCEVLESTIKEILKEVKKPAKEEKGKHEIKELVMTECFLNPQLFKDMALETIFSAFSFEKIQFGYDFVYSYEYNLKNNTKLSLQKTGFKRDFCDVIISMGHLGVYVVPLDPTKNTIIYDRSTYMPLGGLAAQHIFSKSIINKYYGTGLKIMKEEVEEYFKKIRVPLDYLQEIENVVNEGVGNVKILQKQNKEKVPVIKKIPKRKIGGLEAYRKRAKEMDAELIDELDNDDLDNEVEDNTDEITEQVEEAEDEVEEKEDEIEAEKEVEVVDEEEIARKLKREKLIKGATDHRNKQKIIKVLERLNYHILLLEDRHLLITNPSEFMKIRKDRLEHLEKIIKKRTFVRNELKNKKSTHSLALLKKSLAQPDTVVEDNIYLQEIRDAALEDIAIQEEIDYIDLFLRENDPTYITKEENPLDKIRNGYKEKGGININVEFIRTAEALFNPSIVGIEQPGIGESLSCIFQTMDVRNIFITGGFSQIEGIAERVKKEIIPLRHLPNDPQVVTALDPINDSYKGGFLLSKYFQTYTRQEYESKNREE